MDERGGALTARHVQGTRLLVQGEEGQVHGAGTGDGDPGDEEEVEGKEEGGRRKKRK